MLALVSVTKAEPCWACGAATGSDPELGDLGFARCPACGFVFRTDLGRSELDDVYGDGAYEAVRGEHYASDEQLGARRSDARVRLSYLAPHARAGRLLDVGAATGAFVAAAAEAGFDAFGIEPTPSFARF